MSRWWRFVGLAGLALGISSCVEATSEFVAVEGRHETIAPLEGARVENATIALVGSDGAPGESSGIFFEDLRAEAAARHIVFADAKKARYLVQTYFSAEATEAGGQYAYVLDVFTPNQKRAQRLDFAILKAGAGDDLWGPGANEVLPQLAKQAAEDLYAFLSNTPEAGKGRSDQKPSALVSQR